MKDHRTLKVGYKKGISETVTQRTADREAAIQLIIDLLTRILVKNVAASSKVILMNPHTIETGNPVVHSDPRIAETLTGHDPHLQIDLVLPPLSTVCHRVRIFPRMTNGGRPGIGEGTTILAINLVTDTTAPTTCRHFVTTVPREIRGGRRMSTDHGPLHLFRLDLLERTMLQLLALPSMRRTVSIPLRHLPQTPLLLLLQNHPYP